MAGKNTPKPKTAEPCTIYITMNNGETAELWHNNHQTAKMIYENHRIAGIYAGQWIKSIRLDV